MSDAPYKPIGIPDNQRSVLSIVSFTSFKFVNNCQIYLKSTKLPNIPITLLADGNTSSPTIVVVVVTLGNIL